MNSTLQLHYYVSRKLKGRNKVVLGTILRNYSTEKFLLCIPLSFGSVNLEALNPNGTSQAIKPRGEKRNWFVGAKTAPETSEYIGKCLHTFLLIVLVNGNLYHANKDKVTKDS